MTRITRINFSLMHPFHPCNPWLDLGMAEHARFQKLVAEAKKKITEISPQDAAAKLKGGEATIVDVREKDEWDNEHIPDAIHKRPQHGRRLQSLESRRTTNDEMNASITPGKMRCCRDCRLSRLP